MGRGTLMKHEHLDEKLVPNPDVNSLTGASVLINSARRDKPHGSVPSLGANGSEH